jgi:hypothetical protein
MITDLAPTKLESLESDAEFILFSPSQGLISEHSTVGEASSAYFAIVAEKKVGECLPGIYKQQEGEWVRVHSVLHGN